MAYAFRLIAKKDIRSYQGKTLLPKGRSIEFEYGSSGLGNNVVENVFIERFGERPIIYSVQGDFEVERL